MAETRWVKPSRIAFKISPVADLKGIRGGEWDTERRYSFANSVKARAIRERYVDGLRWEDTVLFREIYARRFRAEREIRGVTSMEELAEQYYDRMDALYHSMKRGGFRLVESLPTFYVGRDGDVFIGNQGNHRLAMAQVLNLKRIAGEIKCKHSLTA